MKVFLKGVDHHNWVDLSQYVNMPFTIIDTKDGTGNTCKIIFRFPSDLPYFDVKKALKPKMQIKITEAENQQLENKRNTYLFLTGDNNSVRLRKDVDEEVKGIYEHIVNGVEGITKTDDRFLPNYTITQPKSRYYSSYRKTAKYTYDFDYKFTQDGSVKSLPIPNNEYYSYQQNDDIYTFDFDLIGSRPYLEIKNVNDKSFNVSVGFNISKTAPSVFQYKALIFNKKIEMFAKYLDVYSRFEIKALVVYYNDNDEVIYQKETTIENHFKGGTVPYEQNERPYEIGKIVGFPEQQIETFNVNIEKIENTDKVKVFIDLGLAREEKNSYLGGYLSGNEMRTMKTEIDGLLDDNYVKGLLSSIWFEVESSAYDTVQEDRYLLLSEFVEKALFDYNFNSRHKISLTNRARTLLSFPAKEGEWADYTLKELLERAFLYADGAIPELTINNEIDFTKKEHSSIYVDLEQAQDKETQIIDIDYYDKVVSNTKNLVSEKDFVKERVIISSGDTEFSHITSDNASYLLSNDIYFTAKGIIYTPPEFVIPIRETSSITHNIKGNVLDGNGNIIDGMWDITKRLFEKDIYESLPDARNDSFEKRISPNNYTRGNTIYYESGGNRVGGLTHQAPAITGFDFVFEVENQAQYSIIEILTILALEVSGVATVYKNPWWKIWDTDKEELLELKELIDFELEITYVPYYKELTTKYISNMPERVGLNWEKKVNVNEKVISYSESADILKREMEYKGNVIESFTEKYNSLSETIPTYSEINDNLVVTTKIMTVMNGFIDVDYTLQKNFILQNDDIRLPVAFERYNVPYEYVNRDIFIENHLIFRKTPSLRYINEPYGCNRAFVERIITPQNELNQIEGLLYGKLDISFDETEKNLLMRMTKLEDRFSMVLAGRFVDNYTAGVQRYKEDGNIYYSQPLSYVKWNGIVDVVDNIEIGFTNYLDTRLEEVDEGGGDDYDFKNFPEGKSASLNTRIYELDEPHLFRKDAREGIVLNHTSFLTTEEQDIKWYSFKPPNKIAALGSDIDLRDDLKFKDLDIIETGHTMTLAVYPYEARHENQFEILGLIDSSHDGMYNNGIVLYNEKVITNTNETEIELVGIIKNPEFKNPTEFRFYIISTRYGKLDKEAEIDQWQRTYLYGKVGVVGNNEVLTRYVDHTQVESFGLSGVDSYAGIKVYAYDLGVGVDSRYEVLKKYVSDIDVVDYGYIENDIENSVNLNVDLSGNVDSVSSISRNYVNHLGVSNSGYIEIDTGYETIIRRYITANINGDVDVDFEYIDDIDVNESHEIGVDVANFISIFQDLVVGIGGEATIQVIENIERDLERVGFVDVDVGGEISVRQYLSAEIVGNAIVDRNYSSVATLNKTQYIETDIGGESYFTSYITTKINSDYTIDVGYGSNETLNKVKIIENDFKGVVTRTLGISQEIEGVVTVDKEYVNDIGITKYGGVENTRITKTVVDLFQKPQVTTLATNWCQEITVRIKNNNDVNVRLFADNVNMGLISANTSKDFTFSHSLNDGSGFGVATYFYKTFKFTKVGDEASMNYSVLIPVECSWK